MYSQKELEALGFDNYEAEKFGNFTEIVETLYRSNEVYVMLKKFAVKYHLARKVDLAQYCANMGAYQAEKPANMRYAVLDCNRVVQEAVKELSQLLCEKPGYDELLQEMRAAGHLDSKYQLGDCILLPRKAGLQPA